MEKCGNFDVDIEFEKLLQNCKQKRAINGVFVLHAITQTAFVNILECPTLVAVGVILSTAAAPLR